MTELSRRKFFQVAAMLAAGIALPKVEQPAEQVRAIEADEKVIEVATDPVDRDFESKVYHFSPTRETAHEFARIRADFALIRDSLPGLRGFWPMHEFDDQLQRIAALPKITIGRVPKMPRKYKAELSVEFGTPPSMPLNSQDVVVWYGLHEYETNL